jgi:integrase
MKSKRIFKFPLTPTLIELIQSLPDTNGMLFSGNSKKGTRVWEGTAKDWKAAAPGISFKPSQDVRRTFTTHLTRLGVPKDIRQALLDHKEASTIAKHYDRYDPSAEMRAALDLWGDEIDRALSGETNVINLEAAK